jgi:hypothetical protein
MRALRHEARRKMTSQTIYMALLDEGVDVWRPVQVERLESGRYLVLGPVPDDEKWEFPPGSIVCLEMKQLYEGKFPVAISSPGESDR